MSLYNAQAFDQICNDFEVSGMRKRSGEGGRGVLEGGFDQWFPGLSANASISFHSLRWSRA